MKQNKVIDMGLVITEALAGVAEKFPSKSASLKDLEKSFQDYADVLPDVRAKGEKETKTEAFVRTYAKKFLDNCPFVHATEEDTWMLVPANLKAHKLAKETLEEGGNFVVEQKLRSMVAKKMNQKVSETRLYLEIDDDFKNLEMLKNDPEI